MLASQLGVSKLTIIEKLKENRCSYTRRNQKHDKHRLCIGKSNLDVHFNGNLMKYTNDETKISEFVNHYLAADRSRVLLELTGGHEKILLTASYDRNVLLSVINPYCVRNFAKSYRDLAKTDKIDR